MHITDIRSDIKYNHHSFNNDGSLLEETKAINLKAEKPNLSLVSPFIQVVIDNLWKERNALIKFINEKLDDIEGCNTKIEDMAIGLGSKLHGARSALENARNELDNVLIKIEDAESITNDIENEAMDY